MRHHAAKCYLVLISSFLFYAGDLQAQRPPSSIDTSTTEGLYQYIFQNFDKPRVPTGYLEEYGAPIIPMETFNGILTDSNTIDINLWRTLYWQMQTAYLGSGTNAFGSITTVNNLMDTSLVNNSGIPVPIIVGTFNSVSPTAFTSNELKIVSGQVEDGSNNQNPFLSNNLFASCPAFNYSKTETPSFLFTQNLVLNNTAKTIASVSVNLGDNAGFRTVTWNTPVVANYLDTGWFTWTIKVVLSDNSVLQCYSKFYVAGVNGGIADIMSGVGNFAQAKRKSTGALKTGSGNSIQKSIRYSYVFRNSPDDYSPYTVNATIYVPPTSSYSGVYGNYVPIQYSTQNTSGKLMNPLIVVEGFDVASVAPDITGPYQMSDFVKAIGDPDTYPYDLNTQLDEVGKYDLVFVTFENGTDDITRNAALLEYVIQQVNTMKGTSPNQNVVLGLSMGGLVARYALADMTKKSVSTSTRLLITHDSPHEGANVPLGLQYLIEMVGGVHFFGYNISNVYSNYNEAINILNQTATKQLLIYCATGTNTFANNTFLSGAYRTMVTFGSTGPQPTYQFIATSLGSQCADALFAPYTNLVNIQSKNFLFFLPIVSYKLSLTAQAYAMPSTGNTNTIASLNFQSKFKLFGLITIAKQIYSNSAAAPGTQLPVDGAPGALNNLLGGKNLPNLNPVIVPIPGILNLFGYVSASATGQPATFAFVPVASALDASPFNTAVFSQPFIDGINPNYPSTAKNFIAEEAFPNPNGSGTSYNNLHIQFTARNSQWLFDVMQGISNTINCSTECSTGIMITGPAAFCSSATYTLNVPSTTAITWSALPTGVVNLVPSGNSVVATKVSPNPVTITATINSCSTASLAISTLATSTVTANMSGSCMNGVQDWLLTATPNMPGTNTNWQWTASPNSGITFSSPNSPSTTAYVTKGGGAQVTYKDQCGDISQVNGATIYSQCGGSFVIAPNPASSTLTVSLSPSMVASASTTTITQINIYDNLGKSMKTSVFSQVKTATVDVSNLINGIYVIEIKDESGNLERQKLQIIK